MIVSASEAWQSRILYYFCSRKALAENHLRPILMVMRIHDPSIFLPGGAMDPPFYNRKIKSEGISGS
jgi:hypothetical protein